MTNILLLKKSIKVFQIRKFVDTKNNNPGISDLRLSIKKSEIGDMKQKIEDLRNEFFVTGITGLLRDCFLYYLNNYSLAFAEMTKIYENKKRRYEVIRKISVSEQVTAAADTLKAQIIDQYIKAQNQKFDKSDKILCSLNANLGSDPDNQRYHEAKLSGHGFYITNVLLKDLFQINFQILSDFIDGLTQHNFQALAGIFVQLDKLKGLKFDFETKINIENISSSINEKFAIDYDLVQKKVPSIPSDKLEKLATVLENLNEEFVNKLQSEQPAQIENSHQKLVKNRIDVFTRKIMYRKSIAEIMYVLEVLCKDHKLNRNANSMDAKEIQKEKIKIKTAVRNPPAKKKDSSNIRILQGRIVKSYKDPNTEVAIEFDEPVQIFAKIEGKYSIKTAQNESMYVPTDCVQITDRDTSVYDNMETAMPLLGTYKLAYSKGSKSRKPKFLAKMKRGTTLTSSRNDYTYRQQTLQPGKTIDEKKEEEENYYCGEDLAKESAPPADANDSNLYDTFENNDQAGAAANLFGKPKPAATPTPSPAASKGKTYKIVEDKEFEKKNGLDKAKTYRIVRKVNEAKYEEMNTEIMVDEPVKYLGLAEEKHHCIILSLRLSKQFCAPIRYIIKNYEEEEDEGEDEYEGAADIVQSSKNQVEEMIYE